MAKQSNDFDATMREITAQRDWLIEISKRISAERLERLHACLAAEFPIETALSHAARARDEMLSDRVSVVPPSVRAALAEQLVSRAECARPRRSVTQFGKVAQAAWRLAHVPRPLQLAAAVSLLAAAVALVSHSQFRSSRITMSKEPLMITSADAVMAEDIGHQASPLRIGDSFLRESDNQLTLRVSTTELASFQPSLLTTRYLPDRYDAGLPLDLPVRQSLMDAESSRTP